MAERGSRKRRSRREGRRLGASRARTANGGPDCGIDHRGMCEAAREVEAASFKGLSLVAMRGNLDKKLCGICSSERHAAPVRSLHRMRAQGATLKYPGWKNGEVE